MLVSASRRSLLSVFRQPERIIEFIEHALQQPPGVQAIATIGIAKLMLSGLLRNDEATKDYRADEVAISIAKARSWLIHVSGLKQARHRLLCAGDGI